MLAYNAVYDFLKVDTIWKNWRSTLLAVFPALAVAMTLVYICLHHIFAVFGFVFLAYVIFLTYYFYLYIYKFVGNTSTAESEFAQCVFVPLFFAAATCVTLSCYFWSAEMGLCSAVEEGLLGQWGPSLWRYGTHTGWHLFSALAAHFAMQTEIALDVKDEGRVQLNWFIVPYAVLSAKGE
eukprot:gnl/MRDRNA2_/MRDRNA2_303894_c0_seq1.p1 gnl/MRDRNA2_/MRDRNA2_303894_c0~~gnl/MRDRNA2_/MRDRNA2_303894_c0_seq1.p1  ORF type:complete len:195 (+),score=12.80 gnl/MRDRNA2_/MRDRNA2_303894_c0_seq1:46-585(+)